MILPGKLTLGYLEEDNPLKFYFRVSPLLVKDDSTCQLIEDPRQSFLEDGFIRIVPDKNEINHFKTRMRALGRYCLMDLRRHSGENDKIRPNKNHAGENGDRNAYIVYSDVITALPAAFMAEVAEPDQDGLFPAPGTPLVAAVQDGDVKGIYAWQESGDAACLVGDNLTESDLSAAAEKLMTLTVGDRQVRVLVDLPAWGIHDERNALPVVEEPQPVPAPQPIPVVQAPVPPVAERPTYQREARPEPKPEPALAQHQSAEASASETPQPAPQPEEKPWLQRTTFVFPRVMNPKGGPRGQAMQMQTGFNPPRSTGIKDIVDDMWRQSRLDQLGHPIPPQASGNPVVSPVDKALEAVKEAWSLPEARASLVGGLLKLDDMDTALGANGQTDAAAARETKNREEQLSRYEADRLKILCEIDELKHLRSDKRAELIEELKKTRASEMAQLDKRTKALQESAHQMEQEAEQTRKAAEAASKAFQDVSKGLDDRMTKQLMLGRARDMILAMNHAPRQEQTLPETEDMSAGELVSAVRVRMSQAGVELTNDEAVNLLALAALGKAVAVSGASGSGKSHIARALWSALGITRPEYARYAETQPQPGCISFGAAIERCAESGVPVVRLPQLKQALETSDQAAPAAVLLDDANQVPPEPYLSDLLSQLDSDAPGRLPTQGQDICLGSALRVWLTLQDTASGHPMSAHLLDRLWLVRLAPEAADTPWKPQTGALPQPDKAIALDTLVKVFDTNREVPSELIDRMTTLRKKLGDLGVHISRRALNDMYAYCAAVSPLMTCQPIQVLDWAFAQRAMPAILASAGITALHELPNILPDMPRSLSLMTQPLPLPPL